MTAETDKLPAGPDRRWMCIAYAFPPINRSGTHRTLGFIRQLHDLGWDATVVTVDPDDEPLDPSLADHVPESTRVLRVPWRNRIDRAKQLLRIGHLGTPGTPTASRLPGAGERNRIPLGRSLSDWASRLLVTPDTRTGWIAPAVRTAAEEVRRSRPAILFSTSPYMSAHLIALRLSRRFDLPWVADFRDPWTFNPFREIPYASLRWWDQRLEERVLTRADHVVSCAPTMTAELRRRHPHFEHKFSTILNGFDQDRIERIAPRRDVPPHQFVLTHCGQFYGGRSPAVWFAALRRAIHGSPELAKRLAVQLIGPLTHDGDCLIALAARFGLEKTVHVIGRKSHQDSLAYMRGSDALLLAATEGPGAELQIPNKLFEYLFARRPIIAACAAANPITAILAAAKADAIVCPPDDEAAIAGAVTAVACRASSNPASDWSGVKDFERAGRAAELAEVFERLASPGPERTTARVAPARAPTPQNPSVAFDPA